MADPTTEFLEHLGERGAIPALRRTSGTLRLEIEREGRTDHWRLVIRRGAIAVSRSDAAADCVIRAPSTLFDDLVGGHANAMASALRNELSIDGDPGLLVRFQRLFPPPTGRKRASSARTVGKRRG